jgi:hypothetical protein
MALAVFVFQGAFEFAFACVVVFAVSRRRVVCFVGFTFRLFLRIHGGAFTGTCVIAIVNNRDGHAYKWPWIDSIFIVISTCTLREVVPGKLLEHSDDDYRKNNYMSKKK